jgi:hypothetical protein
VSLDPPGRRRDNGLAIRRHPPLAEVTDRVHRHPKLLDLIGLVALDARSGWLRGLNDPILDLDGGANLAAAGALLLRQGICWFRGIVYAAR